MSQKAQQRDQSSCSIGRRSYNSTAARGVWRYCFAERGTPTMLDVLQINMSSGEKNEFYILLISIYVLIFAFNRVIHAA